MSKLTNEKRKELLDAAGVAYPDDAKTAGLEALMKKHGVMPEGEGADESAAEETPEAQEDGEAKEESEEKVADEKPAKESKEDKDFPASMPAKTQTVEVSGKEKKIGAFFIHRTEDNRAALYNERGQRISPVYGPGDFVPGSDVKGHAKISKDCALYNTLEMKKARSS